MVYDKPKSAVAESFRAIRSSLQFIFLGIIFLTLLSGCQAIKKKSDEIVKKENEKLSKYIGKTSNHLQMDLGKPDEDFKNEKGNSEFIYNKKKYIKKLYGF